MADDRDTLEEDQQVEIKTNFLQDQQADVPVPTIRDIFEKSLHDFKKDDTYENPQNIVKSPATLKLEPHEQLSDVKLSHQQTAELKNFIQIKKRQLNLSKQKSMTNEKSNNRNYGRFALI